jgi:hypothetical protein
MIIIHAMNKQPLPRYLQEPLAERLHVMPAVVVIGARQTGIRRASFGALDPACRSAYSSSRHVLYVLQVRYSPSL